MKLLDATQPAELPTDALLARLRSRRAGLSLIAKGSEAPVPRLSWVYRRLNRRLRKRLRPLLDLLAMRNLVLALRYRLVREPPSAAVLNDSLLNKPLVKLLANDGEPDALVSQLEAALGGDYPFVSGLAERYRTQGPGAVEQQLTEGILQHGLTKSSDPFLAGLISYQVDMRNLLTISKLWRWQISQRPVFGGGGDLSAETLKRVWAASDKQRLARLAAKRAGLSADATTATRLEQQLLQGLTRLLRRAGRDPLGLAVIVEHLWLTQLVQHNRVLRKALAADRETLLEEVLLI